MDARVTSLEEKVRNLQERKGSCEGAMETVGKREEKASSRNCRHCSSKRRSDPEMLFNRRTVREVERRIQSLAKPVGENRFEREQF